MILTNEVIRRNAMREKIRQEMAEWEARNGKVRTAPPSQYQQETGIGGRRAKRNEEAYD